MIAFADELKVIMRWGFRYMQRDGSSDQTEQNWLRDDKGGSLYPRTVACRDSCRGCVTRCGPCDDLRWASCGGKLVESIAGHRTKSLGVEHFGQAGTGEDIYHLHRLDANAIMHAARALQSRHGARYLMPLTV